MPLPVKARAVDGVWIRHAPGHSQLLGRSAPPTDGRWQRADVTSALYLADSPETATAEWYRSLAARGFYPEDYLPFDHHRWRVGLELADLTSLERLDQVGLPRPSPDRRNWPAFSNRRRATAHRRLARTARSERSPPGLADHLHLHSRGVAPARMYAD